MADDELRRIVVADEDEGTRSLVKLTLGEDSFEVIEAADATVAVRAVAQHRPDLLVVAASLPGAEGPALARSIKAQPETAHAAILMLFDKAEPVDQDAGREAGVDEFLAKPFNAFALLKKVNSLIGDDEE